MKLVIPAAASITLEKMVDNFSPTLKKSIMKQRASTSVSYVPFNFDNDSGQDIYMETNRIAASDTTGRLFADGDAYGTTDQLGDISFYCVAGGTVSFSFH